MLMNQVQIEPAALIVLNQSLEYFQFMLLPVIGYFISSPVTFALLFFFICLLTELMGKKFSNSRGWKYWLRKYCVLLKSNISVWCICRKRWILLVNTSLCTMMMPLQWFMIYVYFIILLIIIPCAFSSFAIWW